MLLSPPIWAHTSLNDPQSLSAVQLAQCSGLLGTQYPLVDPAFVGSQKKFGAAAQSACCVHGETQILSNGKTSLHVRLMQSESAVHASPSMVGPGMPVPVLDADEELAPPPPIDDEEDDALELEDAALDADEDAEVDDAALLEEALADEELFAEVSAPPDPPAPVD